MAKNTNEKKSDYIPESRPGSGAPRSRKDPGATNAPGRPSDHYSSQPGSDHMRRLDAGARAGGGRMHAHVKSSHRASEAGARAAKEKTLSDLARQSMSGKPPRPGK